MANQSKVALVTGAGSGVGKATALELMRQNFAVVLAGRRVEPIEAVAAQGKAAGGTSLAIRADVADAASVGALFATIKQTFGRLDVLFNNAGVNAPGVNLEDL